VSLRRAKPAQKHGGLKVRPTSSMALGGRTIASVATQVEEFIGVYDADGTIVGEVSYWIGARLGRTHCSLCELTHGLFTVKREWRECSATLGVPFTTWHRDDAPAEVLAAAAGSYPVVLARDAVGLRVVVDAIRLETFDGDTTKFVAHLHALAGS
jgi:hypothetical protein